MDREQEREQAREFSEMLRQSYEASRFRAGLEWLQGSGGETPGEPSSSGADEAEE